MAVAPGWTSNADAVQVFTEDVLAVAAELSLAGDVASLTASLRELVELASEHVVLVDENPDGALVVHTGAGSFRVVIERP